MKASSCTFAVSGWKHPEMPMKLEALSDALLRRFLLGKVHDEDRERIENVFLIDPEAKQRILIAEQALIEEYLENSLNAEERETFLSVYAQTTEQRQSLRITKSIKEWATIEASSRQTIARRSGVREWLWLKPPLLVPIGIAFAVAIIIVVAWTKNPTRQQRLAIEQQLSELNTPSSLREVPQQMVSIDLSPVTVRGNERQFELNSHAGVQVVELRLPWFQKERFSGYEAKIRRLGDDDSFIIRSLQPESDGRYATRIRVPAHILEPGQYQIRLNGISANGSSSQAEEYRFTVAGYL